ncbi:MAG: hypothetical protein H8E98_07920 [Bacteroidetes bacterium]|nr:hypothetical protein [Bacteroidota bacterium]
MSNRIFVLPNLSKGSEYLKAMKLDIDKHRKSHDNLHEWLSGLFLDIMPKYDGLKTVTPNLDEWSANHHKAGWEFIKEGEFRLLCDDTAQYKFHNYSNFSEASDSLLLNRAKLIRWEVLRLNPLKRGAWDSSKLSNEGVLYTEALFIILGFDPTILNTHTSFMKFTMLEYDNPIGEEMFKDWLIENTQEARILSKNPNFRKPLIPTNEFIKWSVKHEFIKELGTRILSNKPELEKLLFNGLMTEELIKQESKIDSLWVWNAQKNQKNYLAKQLKRFRFFSDNCHKELEAYIQNNDNQIQANISDPAPSSKRIPIDKIIKTLINKRENTLDA